MPPKAKFTKNEIIEKALEIVRKEGMGALTARELGERLGSSSRPIFTVFANMQEVTWEVLKEAKKIYKGYVDRGLGERMAFKGVGMEYIRFARQEPKLFQILFMSESETEPGIVNVLPVIDENYDKILSSVKEPYHLNEEKALKLYRHLWVYTHGIASLCATKVCFFSEDEINAMMTEVFLSILKTVQ